MRGWAADVAAKTVPPVVVIELTDGKKRFFAPAVHASPRPDVGAAFGAPSLTGSGWDLVADFAALPPGVYDVHVLEVSPGGYPFVCDPKRKLEIR